MNGDQILAADIRVADLMNVRKFGTGQTPTAQLLEGSPVLLRLREIEALAQVAGGAGNTVVVALPSEIMAALGGRRGE